jgi:hypothetical protein
MSGIALGVGEAWDLAEEFQFASAMLTHTTKWLGGGKHNDGFARLSEVMADPLSGCGGVRGWEPVVTHSRRALGQDVEQRAANEFRADEDEAPGSCRW